MKINAKKIVKTVASKISEHGPSILAGIGVAGFVCSIGLAVKATPKAEEKIEEAKAELGTDELTPAQTVKAAWKCYIPTAVVAGCSAASVFAGNHISGRRNAALAAVYTVTDQAYHEYKQKAQEALGEKKDKQIQNEIMQDQVNQARVANKGVIDTGLGTTLCYDALSGRLFYGDIERLKRAANDFDRRLRYDSYISLNEWYDELNMPHIKLGDDLGWHIDRGYPELQFGSILVGDTPCVYVRYSVQPKEFYR